MHMNRAHHLVAPRPPNAAASRREVVRGLASVAAGAAVAGWGGRALAQAAPPVASPSAPLAASTTPDADLPGARVLGQARLRFWGFDVYGARLWVAPGFEAARHAQHPFALELTYLRALVGERIAQRSLDEMQALPGFDATRGPAWLAAMKAVFPDVVAGDRLTGLHRPGAATQFRLNGRALGEVADPGFGPLFFGIWLSPTTSQPAMRRDLLGLAA